VSGFFGVLDSWIASVGVGIYLQGVIFVFVLSFIFTVLDLPFSLYSTFVIEEKFGFNKMTFSLWVKDFIKSTLIGLIIMTPLLMGLFWFMDSAGELWWFYAFVFIAFFQFILMYLYPVLIAPLFNKFSPLENSQLNEAIMKLAEKVNFLMSGIFVMDGSKRSAHGNAYFTGFGKNKRIVLFDTLIEKLKREEILAVLAHEIGHQKLKHIPKMLFFSLIMLLCSLWLMSLLMNVPQFFYAFGFNRVSYHAAVIIFAFASSPVLWFITPLSSLMSRRFEYQADKFSIEATCDGQSLKDGLLALSKENLSNLTPHPLYSFFHYSHPTLLERISTIN